MEKLQQAGFIVKLKDLPEEDQKRLNEDFKHFIPTCIAFKETLASTKCGICWDNSRNSKDWSSLSSILLKGTSEYSVVKMLVRFRENKFGVSADIRKFYNTLQLDPSHYKYHMAMWRPNMSPDESPEELVLRVHFYGVRSSGGLCMAAVKKLITFAKEKGLRNIVHFSIWHLKMGTKAYTWSKWPWFQKNLYFLRLVYQIDRFFALIENPLSKILTNAFFGHQRAAKLSHRHPKTFKRP